MSEQNARGVSYQQVVRISDNAYKVTIFTPKQAIKYMARLTKLVGESMAVMSKGPDALPLAVKAFVSRLDEEEFYSLMSDLMTCVSKADNKALNMEIEFQGRLGDLTKLMGKIIEIQFQDFFSALADMFQGEENKQTISE